MTPDASPESLGATPQATTVRYRIVLLAMLVAVLLYLDRICMGTAAQSVAADLQITKEQLDWLLGAFFWTYALGQLPAGWLGDRFGARWMLGAYIFLWSLSTGLLGLAQGALAILLLRLACGLFEAGAYPVAASIVRRWIPIHRRGLASSVVAVGGRMGGALAPILTIQLMLWWTLGNDWWDAPIDAQASISSWRPVMILYGLVGVVVAIAFIVLFRDWPEKHPRVNAAELTLIRQRTDQAEFQAENTSSFSWTSLLRSQPMWLNCFVQFAANFGWVFLVTKMPEYLKDVHGSTQQVQGWLQSLPLAGGIVGLLLGGFFTDHLTQIFGLRWGRAVAMALSRVIVALAFFGCLWVHSPLQATLCLALVGLATDLGTPACWAFGQDVGGKHVGTVVGWFNMWGNFGAAISPVIFGWIVRSFQDNTVGWQSAFLYCGLLNLLAAVAAMGINAATPLARRAR